MTKLRICIIGLTGRMGQALVSAVSHAGDTCEITMGISPSAKTTEFSFPVFKSMRDVFKGDQKDVVDVFIDFSTLEALSENLEVASILKKPMVIGVTGQCIHDILSSFTNIIPIFYASNMSLGIAVLKKCLSMTATVLDESFDLEILELHHKHKKDAPSGTTKDLLQTCIKARGLESQGAVLYNPLTQNLREKGKIGLSVQRGGGVIGDHSVSFIGDDEMLTFTHRGLSRQAYATGALKAARWLSENPVGIYTMDDLLDSFIK